MAKTSQGLISHSVDLKREKKAENHTTVRE